MLIFFSKVLLLIIPNGWTVVALYLEFLTKETVGLLPFVSFEWNVVSVRFFYKMELLQHKGLLNLKNANCPRFKLCLSSFDPLKLFLDSKLPRLMNYLLAKISDLPSLSIDLFLSGDEIMFLCWKVYDFFLFGWNYLNKLLLVSRVLQRQINFINFGTSENCLLFRVGKLSKK